MNLWTIPPHAPFLDAVAQAWLDQAGGDQQALAEGMILLPTRRAARSLAEAFLRASAGRPLLLPRIVALGALDEARLALTSALDLAPAVDPARRLAELTRLVLALRGAGGAPRGADGAWRLAAELAGLMDEAELAELDLAAALPLAADAAFADHWRQTLDFLAIVTSAWPAWLEAEGLMNPAARQVALLRAQAAAWRDAPAGRVWAAGATGAIPAVAALLGAVAHLPAGRVVLPGLDLDLDDAAWEAIAETHPQAGLKRLLGALGARRGDVRPWPGTEADARARLLRRALLPAAALGAWRQPAPPDPAGLKRLAPADQQQEAAAIALVLREALEAPGARAALVTPDRDLAQRVTAELLRFGVVADDSAGERLADTPPAVLLRLLAEAVATNLAPVPLLALLKHPLSATGLAPAACRAAARTLEVACLRGPRPGPGLAGLRRAVADDPAATAFVARLERCIEPFLRIMTAAVAAPVDMLTALLVAADSLATTDADAGDTRLWSGEEGEALAELLAGVLDVLPALPDQRPSCLPGLLDAVLDGAVVRSRRALRGKGGTEHPRVFIWGLLEARLQAVDVVVLGGLAEGVWPPAADPGPWLSRPMRARIGLPSPEERVGQAAHDFVAAACSAPAAVLSCPRRRDGAPTVPARWLARLEACLGAPLPEHPAARWAAALDQPAGAPQPRRPPTPRPPPALRPRRLSVTQVETWLRDPYAVYARHVLRLAPLDPLDQATDAADYGRLVHDGLHAFLDRFATAWPPDAPDQLRGAMRAALGRAGLRRALAAWWEPRLDRIADWVAETEADRRAIHAPVALGAEVRGEWRLDRPGGAFTLVARADRIERRADGSLAILDYKTGAPPAPRDIAAGLAPQLLLEAAMAAAGGFGATLAGPPGELAYWHITGGATAGEQRAIRADLPAAAAGAAASLGALIDAFDDPARPYLSHPHPASAPRFADYALLARVAEWSAAAEEGGAE